MKRIAYLTIISLLPLITSSQGIRFIHNKSWQQVLASAKQQKKFIFVNVFATWCAPCNAMAKEVYPQKKVGDFFNVHFINVAVQLDTTKDDAPEVKARYADAHSIRTKYAIRAFPTYLFFSPDGRLVHRKVGASDAKTFLSAASDALHPPTQYYTIKKQYEAGRRDSSFLRRLAVAANDAYDGEFAYKAGRQYLRSVNDWLNKDAISIVVATTRKTTDTGFQFMLSHSAAVDSVIGAGQTISYLRYLVMKQDIFPVFDSAAQTKKEIDWTSLEQSLEGRYPSLGKRSVLMARIMYERQRKNWPAFRQSVNDYVSADSSNVDPGELNDYAWAVFQNCSDRQCLEDALRWSQQTLSGANAHDSRFLDTYANLLYRLGNQENAIKVETEAAAIRNQPGGALEKTLEKMRNNQPTWE